MKKVVCAISGGVDSAVAAYLLKKQGFQTIGLFMKNWDLLDEHSGCSNQKDAHDAALICRKLNIPYVEMSFAKEYWNDVFSELIRGYINGKSPNPDVLCNKQIKFGYFLKYAVNNLGADAIATGHYAKNSWGQFLQNHNFEAKLLKANDACKDQTLFLSQISQSSLQKSMFPIGCYKKASVKQIASDIGLDFIAKKKESTGICFIGKRNFQKFMLEYLPAKKGYFIDFDDNKIIGEHHGVQFWTIGQRALIPGRKKPYFVVKRNPSDQSIFVVRYCVLIYLFIYS
ncbi:hypothetical protein HELRODRAFT_66727 [Helobdella robusta]|uniref:tRNA-5-taurinomethyluridine 2-sulfurtransferase n=1 Tax=Helobdella robusta TaxID=6412 RepID=T1FYP5_HELRO|nr:hypothetical protein HELRODRAFT_66727 [Helobdella robusta]ESN99395.1 hypothetical protein HELRODRAFT_66727 [Helobdella robusta]